MLTTLGVVEVRPTAATPRLTRRLGGKSLLEWVVRRTTDSLRLGGVIVLAPRTADSEHLASLVPSDVPLVVSDHPDALARFVDALDQYPAEEIVHVAADQPFVDSVLIDRLVTTAINNPQSDYIGYCSRDGRPAVSSPLGMTGQWIRARALRKAHSHATDPADREHIAGYLHSHPQEFNLRLIPFPAELDRDDVRLTIGGEEDWENAQEIIEALGPEHLDYHRIADLLDHQPALRKRMAALNRSLAAC